MPNPNFLTLIVSDIPEFVRPICFGVEMLLLSQNFGISPVGWFLKPRGQTLGPDPKSNCGGDLT